MSKKNKTEMKKQNEQVANVPNPPVPNRAHTEMKTQSGGCKDGACKIDFESKKK